MTQYYAKAPDKYEPSIRFLQLCLSEADIEITDWDCYTLWVCISIESTRKWWTPVEGLTVHEVVSSYRKYLEQGPPPSPAPTPLARVLH